MTGTRTDACAGKRRFPDWAAATNEAKRMRRRHRVVQRAYKCQYCDGYHVGTPSIAHGGRDG